MNKKIKVIIIGFVIIMIASFFLIKRSIAIDIQEKAIELKENGKNEDAIKKINLAIRLSPKNYLFYVTKANFLESQKEYRKAIEEYDKINRFKKNYAEGFLKTGIDFEKIGYQDSAKLRYTKALEAYNCRIQDYANDKEKLYSELLNRACVYLLIEDTLQAEKEFKNLERTYPEYRIMITEFLKIKNRKELLDIFN
ncbi:hypothetical protein ACE1ET_20610 [Saccharicrinis sp. FJH62]|uniref:hypothetical protein n=1 Tax=Saccharicrinis sp. FJH62 TaxID=3344657 RepID=UPI0035D50B52